MDVLAHVPVFSSTTLGALPCHSLAIGDTDEAATPTPASAAAAVLAPAPTPELAASTVAPSSSSSSPLRNSLACWPSELAFRFLLPLPSPTTPTPRPSRLPTPHTNTQIPNTAASESSPCGVATHLSFEAALPAAESSAVASAAGRTSGVSALADACTAGVRGSGCSTRSGDV